MQTVDRKLFRYVLLDLLDEKDFWISGSPDKEKDVLVVDIKNSFSTWIKDVPGEVKPDSKEAKVKLILDLCEKERLEGGTDFKEIMGVNDGPQIRKYFTYCFPGKTFFPLSWCAIFVCFIIGQTGITFPRTADTWELETYGKEKKILFDTPKPGDVFLQYDSSTKKPKHTGFVKTIDPTDLRYILTIEGNSGDSIKHRNDKLISECKFIRYL